MVAHVVDLDDVRVPQARRRHCLALEPRRSCGPEYATVLSMLRATNRFRRRCQGLLDYVHPSRPSRASTS